METNATNAPAPFDRDAFLDAVATPVAVDAEADGLVARYRDALAAISRLERTPGRVPDDVMDAATHERSKAYRALLGWMGSRGVLAVACRTHGVFAHVTGEPDDVNDGIGLMPLTAVAGLVR